MTDAIAERVIRTDIEMTVAARDGQIHLLFNEKNQLGEPVPAYTPNFLMPASDALTLSSLLADLTFEADTGLKAPAAVKQELIERHRKTLTDRLHVVLNSTRERKTTSNRSLARKIVDICMSEIFS